MYKLVGPKDLTTTDVKAWLNFTMLIVFFCTNNFFTRVKENGFATR